MHFYAVHKLGAGKSRITSSLRSVVRHLHDVCAEHIRRNSVHGRSKLLVVQRFGPSVQIKVKVRARDRKWILFLLSSSFCFKK